MRGGRARLTAKARDDLTPRQREVMDLLAAGKTNFEIAEALGITLEGAKYHVSEILARLGVESREEAVSVWSSGQPRRNWRRVVLGMGASAAAAMVAVAAILALTGNGDDHPSSLEPGVWLAWVPHQSEDGKYPLQILHSSQPGQPVRVFDDFAYRLPTWSPDGRYLAVVGLDHEAQMLRLLVFDTADWSRGELDVGASMPALLSWSPDGRNLFVFDRDAVFLAAVPSGSSRQVQDLPAGSQPLGAMAAWSPRGDRAAVVFRGAMSVVTLSGHVEDVVLPAGGSPFPGRAGLYWTTEDSFTAVVAPLGESNGVSLGDMHRWKFERRTGNWQVVRDDPGPAFPESPMPWETEPTGFYQGTSADGRAGIFISMRIDGGNFASHLWTSGENVAVFVLPVTTSPFDGPGIWYDIVVVPP